MLAGFSLEMSASDLGTLAALLDLRQATVDEEFNPSDKAAVAGSEEYRGFRDFIRSSHATERNAGDQALLKFLGLLRVVLHKSAQCRSLDWSWTDHIDADFAVFQVSRPGPRKRSHRSFRGAVDAERRHAFG